MDQFEVHQPLLFSIAYRMLGTAMEAEDMVQETYLRWQKVEQSNVENPKAFLAKTTTRLCLDYLKQARVQREQYVGPWLPEPIVTEVGGDEMLMLSESLSFAFLVMLESLTPTERAVFLLREVFEYEFAEIADVVDKSVANCRQILRRARERVKDKRPRFGVDSAERDRLLTTFMQTCISGDLDGLVSTLDQDIVLWSDGGGKVAAAQKPVRGADKVARFLLGLLRIAPQNVETNFALLNGQPSFVTKFDGVLDNVFIFHVEDGAIRYIYTVRNPDKLQTIARQI